MSVLNIVECGHGSDTKRKPVVKELREAESRPI